MGNFASTERRFEGLAAVAAALAIGVTGCAAQATEWMTTLRTSQGDAALDGGNLIEAEKEYTLALTLRPGNQRARTGLAKVMFLRAQADFTKSKLDSAFSEVSRARKYSPDDPATQALASQIEQAKIRRDIVVANYPLYATTATTIRDSLKTVAATEKEIERKLRGFSYDFDTANLTKAIVNSYDLEEEAHRVTLRLIRYRGLVESGGAQQKPPEKNETPNLLPIP